MDREALRLRLKSETDRLIEELLASPDAARTIDEIEEAALKLRERVGQVVAQELARAEQERAEQEQGHAKKIVCSCGRFARHRGNPKRDVVSMAGPLVVRRAYYYCRLCDKGFCPADRALGLCSGPFTRRVVQEVVRLCALAPYEPAVGLLYELTGVSVSAKEAQRMLGRASAPLERYEQARWETATKQMLSGCAAPDVLYLLADGVQTPILGGWRETKIGAARGMKADGRVHSKTRYVSLLGEAEPFGWKWAALAEEAGVAHAGLVVVLADGSRWIWKQAELHFPDALQILDVWHATERLWEVGRLAISEQGKLHEWMRQRKDELWAYQTDALIRAIAQVAQGVEAAIEKAEDLIGYLQYNRGRMNYPLYEGMGLSVGSGVVESACKQVVTQRLKGAGMRWREAGAQTVASLRCLILGAEWRRFLAHWNRTTIAHAF